jgi:hypothetical protein
MEQQKLSGVTRDVKVLVTGDVVGIARGTGARPYVVLLHLGPPVSVLAPNPVDTLGSVRTLGLMRLLRNRSEVSKRSKAAGKRTSRRWRKKSN